MPKRHTKPHILAEGVLDALVERLGKIKADPAALKDQESYVQNMRMKMRAEIEKSVREGSKNCDLAESVLAERISSMTKNLLDEQSKRIGGTYEAAKAQDEAARARNKKIIIAIGVTVALAATFAISVMAPAIIANMHLGVAAAAQAGWNSLTMVNAAATVNMAATGAAAGAKAAGSAISSGAAAAQTWATGTAAPAISSAAQTAGAGLSSAAQTAGAGLSSAAAAAQTWATGTAAPAISSAVQTAGAGLSSATQAAGAGLSSAAAAAQTWATGTAAPVISASTAAIRGAIANASETVPAAASAILARLSDVMAPVANMVAETGRSSGHAFAQLMGKAMTAAASAVGQSVTSALGR